jgi:hypothetical protein
MSQSSATRRARDGAINLYPAETSLGWRVIRTTTATKAAEKLAAGEWREVYDEHGNLLGCQVLASFKKDDDLPSQPSSTDISAWESKLNAGLSGRSRTAGLPEEKRISLFRKTKDGLVRIAPEDAIERAVEKVKELAGHRICEPICIVDATAFPTRPWDAFQELAAIAD